ncbi:MAG: DUF5018 domain-containing protein [Clostridiales bacterium]|nr:DUF5018 domain-containing protein [Clostridiales bacterium]
MDYKKRAWRLGMLKRLIKPALLAAVFAVVALLCQPPAQAGPIELSIQSFSVTYNGQTIYADVDESGDVGAISLMLPYGADKSPDNSLMQFAPRILASNGATVSPAASIPQDFSKELVYTLSVVDDKQALARVYVVRTSVAEAMKNKAILQFRVGETNGVINQFNKTISIPVPEGADVKNLAPVIVTDGVSVTPKSGEAGDFTEPVVYTVIAQDGSSMQYTAGVKYRREESV